MKIMIKGDGHLGLTTEGESRLEEQRLIHEHCINLADHERPDVYVDLGDLYHTPNPRSEVHAVGIEYARQTTVDDRTSFFLLGNHEMPTRGMDHAQQPIQSATEVVVVDKPVSVEKDGILLAMLPFVTDWKAKLWGFESAQECLNKFAEGILSGCAKIKKILVFGHLEAHGVQVGSDQIVRDIGLHVPPCLLDAQVVERVFIGHIHQYQQTDRVTVVGSCIQGDFGDVVDKGVVVVEV